MANNKWWPWADPLTSSGTGDLKLTSWTLVQLMISSGRMTSNWPLTSNGTNDYTTITFLFRIRIRKCLYNYRINYNFSGISFVLLCSHLTCKTTKHTFDKSVSLKVVFISTSWLAKRRSFMRLLLKASSKHWAEGWQITLIYVVNISIYLSTDSLPSLVALEQYLFPLKRSAELHWISGLLNIRKMSIQSRTYTHTQTHI